MALLGAGGAAGDHRNVSVKVRFAGANLSLRTPETDKTTTLRSLVEKAPDVDVIWDMIGFAVERLMEMEVGGLTGAAWGETSAARLAQRNSLPRA
jgi:hypothetical protein